MEALPRDPHWTETSQAPLRPQLRRPSYNRPLLLQWRRISLPELFHGVRKHSMLHDVFQVKGVIFDSSPGRRRMLSLYKAISAILGGNCLYNTTMSFLFTFFCSMIWLWEVAQKYIGGAERDLVADPFDRLRTEPHAWPQHFIYSEADDLISHKDVETFIRHRESIGIRVSALRYKSSPHVKHLSHHKESYEASVLAFANECLRDADMNDEVRLAPPSDGAT